MDEKKIPGSTLIMHDPYIVNLLWQRFDPVVAGCDLYASSLRRSEGAKKTRHEAKKRTRSKETKQRSKDKKWTYSVSSFLLVLRMYIRLPSFLGDATFTFKGVQELDSAYSKFSCSVVKYDSGLVIYYNFDKMLC